MTGLYAPVHFFVDGICAWAMLGRLDAEFGGILLYNFCAFAMQLPLGAVLDRLSDRRWPLRFAALGCGLTVLGAFCHPAVLGVGNALFHVGGGVDVIRDGGRRECLGIFVAPGAMGLYLGGLLAGKGPWLLLPVGILLALLLKNIRIPEKISTAPSQKPAVSAALCCFAVVVLRSLVGFQVVFPWKTGALAFATVGAVVLGKMLGGVLAARLGGRSVTVWSLTLAAVGYALGAVPAFGLLALLCFNMTMPLTLFSLWRLFPDYPGTVFGSLTLALFLGFLPFHYGVNVPIGGVLGSILSLVLLWKAVEDA